ncbi:MAG: hypothetical protein MK101_01475 [Phycisphaerales bacterium]|nr:hypothetical protein [Phycisphaerales bacterium]
MPVRNRTAWVLMTSMGCIGALTEASAGHGRATFVAGDALGVELHCAAVLALATPEVDPVRFDPAPVVLAEATPHNTTQPETQTHPESTSPAHLWAVDAPAMTPIESWSLWSDLAIVFWPTATPMTESGMLFAIVH